MPAFALLHGTSLAGNTDVYLVSTHETVDRAKTAQSFAAIEELKAWQEFCLDGEENWNARYPHWKEDIQVIIDNLECDTEVNHGDRYLTFIWSGYGTEWSLSVYGEWRWLPILHIWKIREIPDENFLPEQSN